MSDLSLIPSDHYAPARDFVHIKGYDYRTMKRASLPGGILKRWRSPKTRRVYYMHKNRRLL